MALSPDTKLIVKTSTLSAVFTVVLLILINYFVNHSWALGGNSASKNPPITVQGTGTVLAQPDQSSVSFTVSKTANTLKDAQNQTNTAINAITADLAKIGVEKKDIQTSNYNSSPNYQNDTAIVYRPNQSQTITSYTVSEDVIVTIHNDSLTSKVIDTATSDNAENVYGPNLTFSDAKQQDVENQARTKAIENAKQKAQTMADAAGIHLGKLTKIEDGTQNPYPIIRPLMMTANGDSAMKAAPTQINVGQNQISASVTLTYETY